MQIEDYFNFLAEDDIRITGTRIGIETVLDEYVHDGKTAEAIADRYHTVTPEHVYATILYYLQNPEKVGAYLEDYLEYCQNAREEYEKNLPPVVVRLRALKAKRQAVPNNSRPNISKDGSASTTPSPSKAETERNLQN